MKTIATATIPNGTGFGYFRIGRAKQAVDLNPGTLRNFFKQGLPFHRKGRCVFVSKSELETFLASK